MSRLLRLVILVAGLTLGLSQAGAQPPSANNWDSTEPTTERSPPALPYALATIFTLVILSIICVPSRKA
jgi:hypothetical protein